LIFFSFPFDGHRESTRGRPRGRAPSEEFFSAKIGLPLDNPDMLGPGTRSSRVAGRFLQQQSKECAFVVSQQQPTGRTESKPGVPAGRRMWNRPNGLPRESRRGIGGSALFHFRAAVRTRASASNKNRPWSWARLAARAALFGAAVPGTKRKCLEDLFPQPPRIAVHGMPDPRLHRSIHRFPIDETRGGSPREASGAAAGTGPSWAAPAVHGCPCG
jgi:hypothetical protein